MSCLDFLITSSYVYNIFRNVMLSCNTEDHNIVKLQSV